MGGRLAGLGRWQKIRGWPGLDGEAIYLLFFDLEYQSLLPRQGDHPKDAKSQGYRAMLNLYTLKELSLL